MRYGDLKLIPAVITPTELKKKINLQLKNVNNICENFIICNDYLQAMGN